VGDKEEEIVGDTRKTLILLRRVTHKSKNRESLVAKKVKLGLRIGQRGARHEPSIS